LGILRTKRFTQIRLYKVRLGVELRVVRLRRSGEVR